MKKQLNQLRRFFARTGTRKLNAATAREVIPASYDDDDNSNRLSGAFIVVLALHVIALVGVFAFSRMKDPKPTALSPSSTQSSSLATEPVVTPKPDPTFASQEATPTPAPAPVAQYASLQSTKPSPAASVDAGDRSDTLRSKGTSPGTHIVKSGENLTKIALAYSVKSSDLMAANNLKSDEIRVGQELVIPTGKTVRAAATTPSATKAPEKTTPTKTNSGTYTVRKNETLVKIARDQRVDYNELVKLNGIKDPRKLQEGQTLKLPKKG
jgi:LysM repeat protein